MLFTNGHGEVGWTTEWEEEEEDEEELGVKAPAEDGVVGVGIEAKTAGERTAPETAGDGGGALEEVNSALEEQPLAPPAAPDGVAGSSEQGESSVDERRCC